MTLVAVALGIVVAARYAGFFERGAVYCGVLDSFDSAKTRMRTPFLTVLTWSLLYAWGAAAPMTYHVGPVTLKYDGFHNNAEVVVEGTITTNGTTGLRAIGPDDIIDYWITVDGPLPYTFHPGNPSASVSSTDVSASSAFLTTSGHFGTLFIRAQENTLPNCSECNQVVAFRSYSNDVTYRLSDDDNDPPFATAVWHSGGSQTVLIGRTSSNPPLPGDYNDNRAVDAADYVAWRTNLLKLAELQNDTSFGYVNEADFSVWAKQFGESTLEATALAVPEVSTALLAMVGLFALPKRRRCTEKPKRR